MINVGDYVRTKSGISKIKNIIDNNDYIFYKTDNELGNCTYSSDGVGYFFNKKDKDKIIYKSSTKPIDLIKVGDYVNGNRVLIIENGEILFGSGFGVMMVLKNEDIKTIVTKEQFESIQYEVG